MRVLICGGGVIGASIAYFLSCRGVQPIVIERTALACAASGKAGGFLAQDWCDGTPLEALARRSFALHAELAEQIGGEWGYRRLTTYGGLVSSQASSRPPAHETDWVSDHVTLTQRLGSARDDGSGASRSVHGRPDARRRGARGGAADRRSHGRSARPERCEGDRASNVDGEIIEGDAVVIAMGPWSILAARWLPLPGVFGLKGHSLVFETGTRIPPEALFLECQEGTGASSSPEVFPRADGTTYVCAISSESPLPVDPAAVMPDPGAIERLQAICARLSPVLAESKVLAQQACYRPVTQDGLPLIGPRPGPEGAYIATGHSVWGILNAPATGEAMAELILDGEARTLDLSPFILSRFPSSRA